MSETINRIKEIEEQIYNEIPLVGEYETDSRDRWPARFTALLTTLHERENEIARLKTMSTAEMMCENKNVRHHVTEWEERCSKAEAEVARLRTALKKYADANWQPFGAGIDDND
jgi:hypothetical protein